ncbi:MAG: hypothetical protein K6F28_09965 [Lachnospiraceae bacterium]|nr:hypothetical protein [Lachnospiraceae bacterium]
MMKFTRIPVTTFKELIQNAGIIVDSFVPATGTIGNLLCATSGGLNFDDDITFVDFGEDIDNCKKNTKELKKIDSRTSKISGTGLTISTGFLKVLMAAADIDPLDDTHVIPRSELEAGDFHDLWWIGDYSDKNGVRHGGFVAVHLKDALSTGGFHIKSSDKNKGQFTFEFTAHSSIEDQEDEPYDVYIQAGTDEGDGYRMSVLSVAGTSVGYTAITTEQTAGSGESYVYQTGADLNVPGEGTTLVGTAWTAWDGDDEIESDAGLDIVVAIVDASHKAVHAGKTIVAVKES